MGISFDWVQMGTLTVHTTAKNLLVPSAKTNVVAGMLANIQNCFHPNQVSQYFGLEPPTVEEYLRI